MSSNRSSATSAQKPKKGKEPAPPADTTIVQLEQLMRNGRVVVVVVEALGGGEFPAAVDPGKREMGKKKNHWVLRLILSHPFTYFRDGKRKACLSVRLSVEHPPGSLVCQHLTLKAMGNDVVMSRSAYVSFQFKVPQANRTVKEFEDVANQLLPFQYTVVARTLQDNGDTASGGRGRNDRQSGRNQDLFEHPNGCRDFTAQWFYHLHCRGLVVWEAFKAQTAAKEIQPIQETQAFHHIIGYRYSPTRVDYSPIAMAKFKDKYERVQRCMVELIMRPDAGQLQEGGKYTVVLPYRDQPPVVQTFKRGPK